MTDTTWSLEQTTLDSATIEHISETANHLYGAETAIENIYNEPIVGTEEADSLNGVENLSLWGINGGRGNDIIVGEAGNDTLYGDGTTIYSSYSSADNSTSQADPNAPDPYRGDDILFGGAGDDYLVGSAPVYTQDYDTENFWTNDYSVLDAPSNEVDTFIGGTGADTFAIGGFYDGSGYAIIADFNRLEGDKIQLQGNASDYSIGTADWFGSTAVDTIIEYQGDVVGVVTDTTEIFAEDYIL